MFEQELEKLEQQHLIRHPLVVQSACGPRITINNRSMLHMCSNDYLGLAAHPAVKQAAVHAMEYYGFGSGSSRLVSGTSELHVELEQRLAEFKGMDAALLFNSGYAANTGIIAAVAGENDAILSDSLNHASIIDGCRLSKAHVHVYKHKDMGHLEMLLKENQHAGKRLIITDSIFSMDGDIAPLPDIVMLAEKYHAICMVDDAHATGVFGSQGRGSVEHFGLEGRVQIQMGTLGKALGSCGAFVAGDRGLIAYLANTARSYMFSTSLPPAVCAATLAALDIVQREPALRIKLWNNRTRFVKGLEAKGISLHFSESPILPVVIGDSGHALQAGRMLLEQGVFAAAIRPPTVPLGTARIRATVMAAHSDDDIDQAIECFSMLAQAGLIRA